MVLEVAYGAFSGIVLVYVWGYEMVSDIQFLLDETLVFSSEFFIKNLEVVLMVSQSEVVHYGVVGYNMTLVLLEINRGDKDGVGVKMVGGQDVLITAAILNG